MRFSSTAAHREIAGIERMPRLKESLMPTKIACTIRSLNRPVSRGLTLLEVVLALGVLVVVAALALPMLGSTLDQRRLKLAAEQLAADLGQARVRAISSGTVFVWHCPQQADRYFVEPYSGFSLPGAAAPRTWIGEEGLAGDASRSDLTPLERPLPDGVLLMASELHSESREWVLLDEIQGESLHLPGAGGGPESMIFCYPDGTTSNARITLQNRRQRSITVELRGMTGVATVGEIQSAGEPLP